MSEQTTKTVAEEALELAQWLGTGQALLARLQESYAELRLLQDVAGSRVGSDGLRQSVGILIREAVEHFGRMP